MKDQLTNVFIHGSYANAMSWKKIIQMLDPDEINIAVNLPGHGGRPDPDDFDNPTLNPEIQSIKDALIKANASENDLHLIGHSYGGVVALGIALSNILPAKKLTLFEPVDVSVLPIFGEVEAASVVIKLVAGQKAAIERSNFEACERVIDFWGGEGSFRAFPKIIQDQMLPLVKNNMRHWVICFNNGKKPAEYNALNIPVTFIHGTRSNSVAKTICTSLNENLPNSNIQVIENASHFMINSHPEECVKILRKSY